MMATPMRNNTEDAYAAAGTVDFISGDGAIKLRFIAVKMRLPLKFGAETIDSLRIAHVEWSLYGTTGYGETPLSAAWAWPSEHFSFALRERTMMEFCRQLAMEYRVPDSDPISAGYFFLTHRLKEVLSRFSQEHHLKMPYLAALICASAFDLALHDAFGKSRKVPTFHSYNAAFMEHDLEYFFHEPAFRNKYPQDYFVEHVPDRLPVWHLVGGRDLLRESERDGSEPDDGYPVSLEKWIERDGLTSLKIKLTGSAPEWDFQRLVAVGRIAREYGCDALSPDFNCRRVRDPAVVNTILDRLKNHEPELFNRILYVEQPFPCELEDNRIDVHSCAARKPLFMDESAHDWHAVKSGCQLGWNGVALKTCKTMTGALLSACWAREHGMALMVQDLTNPMLATIPHVLLAAYIGTIHGVECNAPQFYPATSLEYEKRHPGLYERRHGTIALDTLTGNGFGY